jgi:hypothetical protein
MKNLPAVIYFYPAIIASVFILTGLEFPSFGRATSNMRRNPPLVVPAKAEGTEQSECTGILSQQAKYFCFSSKMYIKPAWP